MWSSATANRVLVEAKAADEALSPALAYSQQQTQAEHALQAVWAAKYVAADAFSRHGPVVVPARPLLSQLL